MSVNIGNHMRPLTALVGRDTDLDALLELAVGGAQLLTLVGPAGIGKTSLAAAAGFALTQRNTFDGGVWHCDLTAATTARDFYTTVAASLRVPVGLGGGTASPQDELAAQLLLLGAAVLIVDNVDHVLQDARRALETWIAVAPELCVIATSREPLGSTAEHVQLVGPLSLATADAPTQDAAAVALFLQRARVAHPQMVTTREVLDATAALVARLDGIPLAIELAAARVALFSPAELLARISDRFALLRPSHPTGTTRGLWEAIHMSWESLSPSAQRALMALSVFRGGATADAMESVLKRLDPTSEAVVDDLQALVRKSLVNSVMTPEPAAHRRLTLYESVKDFAATKLAEMPAEQHALRQAHREWFVRYAEPLVEACERHVAGQARHLLAAELANGIAIVEDTLAGGPTAPDLQTGVCALLAVNTILRLQGPLERALRYFQAFMPRVAALPAHLRALAGKEYGALLSRNSEERPARAALEAALDAAIAANDPCIEGRVLRTFAMLASFGDLESLEPLARRAVVLLTAADGRDFEALAHESLGFLLLGLGRYDEARAELESAIAMMRRGHSPENLAVVVNNLATLWGRQGAWPEAEQLFIEALDAARKTGKRVLECVVLANLGECATVRDDHETAKSLFTDALALATDVGYPRVRALATAELGAIAHHEGRVDDALAYYHESLAHQHRSWPDRVAEGVVLSLRGLAETQLGRAAASKASFAQAQVLLEAEGDPRLLAALALNRLHARCFSASAPTRGDALAEGATIARDAEAEAKAPFPGNRRRLLVYAERLLASGLGRRLADDSAPPPDESPASSVAPTRIDALGREFVTPDGETVSLGRKAGAKRILALLAEQRIAAPGVGVSLDAVFEAGWPDDKVHEPYRSNRVYVVISLLRKAGLGELLIHDGDGYLLDPRKAVLVG